MLIVTVALRCYGEPMVIVDREWLLTVKQVAARLGLQEGTIRTWLARGRLPKVRCGRAVRVPASAIKDFIKRNTVPARADR
jgi:excisionase family DNA binding protein